MKPYPFEDYLEAKKRLSAAFQAQEPYLLLTGGTGSGKTALLGELREGLDRCRYRIIYFHHAGKLTCIGLIRLLARSLRVQLFRSYSETLQAMERLFEEETADLFLWLDEAHELPEETLSDIKTLAEKNFEGKMRLRILLVGLPELKERLQAHPQLWRRFSIREEITGLRKEELSPFLQHHFADQSSFLGEEGLQLLFEYGKGIPGYILPLFKQLLQKKPQERAFHIHEIEEILQSWLLP